MILLASERDTISQILRVAKKDIREGEKLMLDVGQITSIDNRCPQNKVRDIPAP